MTQLDVQPNPLIQGENAQISVSGATPSSTITVTIDDGGAPTPTETTVQVAIDENGNGSATWGVPSDWGWANFNTPGALEVARRVAQAD